LVFLGKNGIIEKEVSNMAGPMMEKRDLQKEITELGILGIETSDGVLTQSIIADAIDAHKQTLAGLDLDKISHEIDRAEKAFANNV
jgi:hypothetical protein